MEKREENIRRLKKSLEVSTVIKNMILCTVVVLIFSGVGWLKHQDVPETSRLMVGLFIGFWLIFMMVYGIWLLQIFRSAQGYVFCKTRLCSLRRGIEKNTMGFYVTLEVPGVGKVNTKTRAIFQTHGWPGPLVENYVNQEVEIAYNCTTRQVVVIG